MDQPSHRQPQTPGTSALKLARLSVEWAPYYWLKKNPLMAEEGCRTLRGLGTEGLQWMGDERTDSGEVEVQDGERGSHLTGRSQGHQCSLAVLLKGPTTEPLAVPAPAAPLSFLPTHFLQEAHTKSLLATVHAGFSGS